MMTMLEIDDCVRGLFNEVKKRTEVPFEENLIELCKLAFGAGYDKGWGHGFNKGYQHCKKWYEPLEQKEDAK